MTNILILMTNVAVNSTIEWSTDLTNWHPYIHIYPGARLCQFTVTNAGATEFWRWRSATWTNPATPFSAQISNDTIDWSFLPNIKTNKTKP